MKTTRRARRSHPAINAGTVVYLVELLGKYYAYCYLRKEDAEYSAQNLKEVGLDTDAVFMWNFKSDPEMSLHVHQIPGRKYANSDLKTYYSGNSSGGPSSPFIQGGDSGRSTYGNNTHKRDFLQITPIDQGTGGDAGPSPTSDTTDKA